MCRNALYQIDKQTGQVTGIFYFRIPGIEHDYSKFSPAIRERVFNPEEYSIDAFAKNGIYFAYFCITADGNLVLAPNLPIKDQALWKTANGLSAE